MGFVDDCVEMVGIKRLLVKREGHKSETKDEEEEEEEEVRCSRWRSRARALPVQGLEVLHVPIFSILPTAPVYAGWMNE